MPIAPRSAVPAATRPARRHETPRKPPTREQLSAAVYRLLDELAKGRNVSQQVVDAMAVEVYAFAAKSVETAWSVVDAAIAAVTAYAWRRTQSGANRGNPVADFKAGLEKAKTDDLARADDLFKEGKAAEGEAKAALEQEWRELLLRDAQPGTPLRLGPSATAFLQEGMVRWFRPVEGSPLAKKDLPRLVAENRRFFDFLGTQVLFGTEEGEGYAAAKAADKAARIAAASEPAPPAEEEEAPAAEPEAEAPAAAVA